MNKKLILTIGIFVVVLIAVFFVRTNQKQSQYYGSTTQDDDDTIILNDAPSQAPTQENTPQGSTTEDTAEPSGISSSELAQHNKADDCWVIYDGKVYDVTSWIPKHPGGEKRISDHCGKQTFEAAFTQKHGTSKVGMLMNVAVVMGDFDVVGELSN